MTYQVLPGPFIAAHRTEASPKGPLSPHPRLDWLDGVRTYATVGVIAVHSSQVAAIGVSVFSKPQAAVQTLCQFGQYGVQLFFIISALSVYLTLGRFPYVKGLFRGWLVKRYFRIAPLYYLAIPVYFLVGKVTNVARVQAGLSPREIFSFWDALMNTLFLHAWDPHSNNHVVPGGWSIAVEIMFYISAPLYFWLYRRGKLAFLIYPLIALFCLEATHLAASGPVLNNSFWYYWFPTQLPVLLCGLMFCKLTSGWLLSEAPVPPAAVPAALCTGALALGAAAWAGVPKDHAEPFAPLLIGIASCCLIVLARSVCRPLFSNRFAVWAGRISYSVYIVHFLVLDVIHFLNVKLHFAKHFSFIAILVVVTAFTFAGSLMIASFTRLWIEEPGIHVGRRLARKVAAA